MTRNVTIRVNEALLTALRHRAVDADMSLSAWITCVLEDQVRGDRDFKRARRRALQRLEQGFSLGGKPLTREESHVR